MKTSSASYYFMLRYAIALAPLIAPFAMSDRAEANCDPRTPLAPNTTVRMGFAVLRFHPAGLQRVQ